MEAKKGSLPETRPGALPGAWPGPGEFCRDAEGNMYQVIGLASHSKTGEEMVIYQALHKDYRWYACPALEFCLERTSVAPEPPMSEEFKGLEKKEEKGQKEEKEQKEEKGQKEEKSQIREELLLFLDAEGAGEKLAVLRAIRRKLDESLLTSIELSLDLIPDESESPERRLDLIERTLEKREKYEGSRLRFK